MAEHDLTPSDLDRIDAALQSVPPNFNAGISCVTAAVELQIAERWEPNNGGSNAEAIAGSVRGELAQDQ